MLLCEWKLQELFGAKINNRRETMRFERGSRLTLASASIRSLVSPTRHAKSLNSGSPSSFRVVCTRPPSERRLSYTTTSLVPASISRNAAYKPAMPPPICSHPNDLCETRTGHCWDGTTWWVQWRQRHRAGSKTRIGGGTWAHNDDIMSRRRLWLALLVSHDK